MEARAEDEPPDPAGGEKTTELVGAVRLVETPELISNVGQRQSPTPCDGAAAGLGRKRAGVLAEAGPKQRKPLEPPRDRRVLRASRPAPSAKEEAEDERRARAFHCMIIKPGHPPKAELSITDVFRELGYTGAKNANIVWAAYKSHTEIKDAKELLNAHCATVAATVDCHRGGTLTEQAQLLSFQGACKALFRTRLQCAKIPKEDKAPAKKKAKKATGAKPAGKKKEAEAQATDGEGAEEADEGKERLSEAQKLALYRRAEAVALVVQKLLPDVTEEDLDALLSAANHCRNDHCAKLDRERTNHKKTLDSAFAWLVKLLAASKDADVQANFRLCVGRLGHLHTLFLDGHLGTHATLTHHTPHAQHTPHAHHTPHTQPEDTEHGHEDTSHSVLSTQSRSHEKQMEVLEEVTEVIYEGIAETGDGAYPVPVGNHDYAGGAQAGGEADVFEEFFHDVRKVGQSSDVDDPSDSDPFSLDDDALKLLDREASEALIDELSQGQA